MANMWVSAGNSLFILQAAVDDFQQTRVALASAARYPEVFVSGMPLQDDTSHMSSSTS